MSTTTSTPSQQPTTTTAFVHTALHAPPVPTTVRLTALRADEALVEIHASGICHTDLSCANGVIPAQFPCVFGHEGAGVVVAVGSSVPASTCGVGDKVLLSFASCQSCEQCKAGYPSYCLSSGAANFGQRRRDGSASLALEDGTPLNGSFFGQSSFARFSIVDMTSIVKVPADTDVALFAPLGCGFQTGAGAVLNTLNVTQGSSLVVFGVGGVGMAALLAGTIRRVTTLVAVDLNDGRLALAKQLGATHTIRGDDKDLLAKIQEACPPTGANFAVDCTGVPKVIETMVECLGRRGKASSVGAPSPGSRVSIDIFSHLVGGKQYVGCCEGDSTPSKFIPYLMDEYKKGNFPVDKLVKFYDVADAEQAFKDTEQGKTIKAVLKWSDKGLRSSF